MSFVINLDFHLNSLNTGQITFQVKVLDTLYTSISVENSVYACVYVCVNCIYGSEYILYKYIQIRISISTKCHLNQSMNELTVFLISSVLEYVLTNLFICGPSIDSMSSNVPLKYGVSARHFSIKG